MSFLYEPFYVGKGKNDRYKNHKYDKNITYKVRLIQKLLGLGYVIDDFVIIFNKGLSNDEALLEEINTIKYIGRKSEGGPLTNITEGGDGRSSDEMKEWNKKYWSNPKHIEHLSRMVKQKQWDTEEGGIRKQKLSENIDIKGYNSKLYIVTDDKSNQYFVAGLFPWCRKMNLSRNILRSWVNRGIIDRTSVKDTSFFTLENKRKLRGWRIDEVKRIKIP